jgi:hypothetical protein
MFPLSNESERQAKKLDWLAGVFVGGRDVEADERRQDQGDGDRRLDRIRRKDPMKHHEDRGREKSQHCPADHVDGPWGMEIGW